MLAGIIIAYIVIAVTADILISVGIAIIISQRYVYLPEEFWPKANPWVILLMAVFWPITILLAILQGINEFIIKKIKKED